jgi:hypothetical protein
MAETLGSLALKAMEVRRGPTKPTEGDAEAGDPAKS